MRLITKESSVELTVMIRLRLQIVRLKNYRKTKTLNFAQLADLGRSRPGNAVAY